MKTCKNCIYWVNRGKTSPLVGEDLPTGICEIISTEKGFRSKDGAYWDGGAYLYTNEDFGCVHFKPEPLDAPPT